MKNTYYLQFCILLNCIVVSCQNHPQKGKNVINKTATTTISHQDTLSALIPNLKPYDELVLDTSLTLVSAPGTKSVLFNNAGNRLYALNLEGLSVYEFDQAEKKIIREFKFKPSKGKGWNYKDKKEISSFQEKPVEAAISNHDSILWVSLHNAEGIVPIFLNDIPKMEQQFAVNDSLSKQVTIEYMNGAISDTGFVPLIKTGKTPKVIAVDRASKNLLVSNWHSNSTSVLAIDEQYPYAHVLKNITMGAIPRGIAIDNDHHRSYVAIMGGSQINVINNDTWEKETAIQVASNPRHVVMDDHGRLFVSYNILSEVACIDPITGKTLFSAKTSQQPRTIALSKNKQFLFVTCYKGDKLDVFKIGENGFTKIYSLNSKGSPVGVDIFENDDHLEAWICNYTIGAIKVFVFSKQQSQINLVSINRPPKIKS